MRAVFTDTPLNKNNYFSILVDYTCSREGNDIFFCPKRKIVYGDKIYRNKDEGSLYINCLNSLLGRKINAHLFLNESSR